MDSASTSSWVGENASVPIARIDAQDQSYILPLREYLETNGVAVQVNNAPSVFPSYHLVAGDMAFVKDIFYRTAAHETKRLGLVVGFSGKDISSVEYQAKIVMTDPVPMTHQDVLDIFEFFFVSDKKLLDLRKEVYSRTPHENSGSIKQDDSPAKDTYVGDKSSDVAVVKVDEVPLQEHMLSQKDKERIGSIMADVFGDQANPEEHKKRETKQRKKKMQRQWIGRICMGLGFMVLPFFWYVVSILISTTMLFFSARALAAGNIAAVGWQTQVAQYWEKQGSFVVHAASIPLGWVGMEGALRGQERLLSFLTDATRAEIEVQSLAGIGQKVAGGLLNQVDVSATGTTPAADITELRSSLYTVQNTLGLAQAELSILLKDRTFPFSFSFLAARTPKVIGELATLRTSMAYTDELLSLFLQLSGFKEPRTYLVLLQNSMELRPTGGFIGSVAVASFADGRLTSLDVQDVYTFDGQLKGHVDPPVPIRQILGQEHWYMRDSNWDPDFLESAQKAAWFYQKETGNSVDGVFAINVPFVLELLKATGPIDLSDYNDRISADNFYGKSIYYTQNDFFPGSTQKKDFLGTLTRALIAKITSGKEVNMPKLFAALTHALGAHDVIMMFGQPDMQSLIEHYGWAGRVPSLAGCNGVESTTCRFDPLAVVEANLGVNKVNYFIERAMDRQVTIDPDGVLHEAVTLSLKNTSAGQDKGMGYRVYTRFLLPSGSVMGEVTLDGAPLVSRDAGKTAQPIPFVEKSVVAAGNFTVGAAIDVPAGVQKRLTISYSRPAPLVFGQGGTVLDIFDQKQPGVSGTPVHTVIHFPFGWVAGVEEGEGATMQNRDFIAKEGQVEYNTILDRDMLTRIRFTK